MIIAIDGPAGSGKSTTARAVARRLGFRHLESGAFYRGLTYAALRAGLPPERWTRLDESTLERFELHARPDEQGFRIYADEEDITDRLRASDINAHVSRMARVPAVRGWLLRRLRSAALDATAQGGGLVCDGRDIGSVVFPGAEVKIFLTARPEVRARRRLAEHGQSEPDADRLLDETRRLLERDRMDSQRAVAPLRKPADAFELDTSDLSFDEQVEAIIRLACT